MEAPAASVSTHAPSLNGARVTLVASTAGRATGACGWAVMTVAAHRFRRLVLPQSAMGRVGTSLLPASMPRTSTRELHDYSSCWLSTQGPSAKKRTMMIAAPLNECVLLSLHRQPNCLVLAILATACCSYCDNRAVPADGWASCHTSIRSACTCSLSPMPLENSATRCEPATSVGCTQTLIEVALSAISVTTAWKKQHTTQHRTSSDDYCSQSDSW